MFGEGKATKENMSIFLVHLTFKKIIKIVLKIKKDCVGNLTDSLCS